MITNSKQIPKTAVYKWQYKVKKKLQTNITIQLIVSSLTVLNVMLHFKETSLKIFPIPTIKKIIIFFRMILKCKKIFKKIKDLLQKNSCFDKLIHYV